MTLRFCTLKSGTKAKQQPQGGGSIMKLHWKIIFAAIALIFSVIGIYFTVTGKWHESSLAWNGATAILWVLWLLKNNNPSNH